MKEPITQFAGPKTAKGIIPKYAIFMTKNGTFEIHIWKKVKRKGVIVERWGFHKALVNIEHVAKKMLTLTTGDVLATDIQTLVEAWENAIGTIVHALESKLEEEKHTESLQNQIAHEKI